MTIYSALWSEFTKEKGASQDKITRLENRIGIDFPEDYLEFLRVSNGGEGFVGCHYLVLWKAEELEEFNDDYEVNENAPGIFLFGSDGGGEGFGFDLRSKPYRVLQVPFIGMSVQDAKPVADGFSHFIERLMNCKGSLF
ncbi:hypothetical protein GCM10007426_20070 [Alloalcanivorax dieselolei]|uniref:SMI1/KNR4 family protein n=1 Tax=Alloalcanivorax TaxID=3020832 RepID=UPI0016638379|nr:SMI1/KNR4 family protein [Alloalcanivorax dieselolei]GGJ90870.1 hypothetical protein GCM10007426_20070 [Alloalcanivorax dieselolei]